VHHFGIACSEQLLDFVEIVLGDQGWHGHDGVFSLRFPLFGTVMTVEAMLEGLTSSYGS
jgi:hypothetical protein